MEKYEKDPYEYKAVMLLKRKKGSSQYKPLLAAAFNLTWVSEHSNKGRCQQKKRENVGIFKKTVKKWKWGLGSPPHPCFDKIPTFSRFFVFSWGRPLVRFT